MEPRNLERLTPRFLRFQILSAPDRPLQAGDRVTYRIRLFGVPMSWVTHIASMEPGHRFSDDQEQGPYKRWLHTHTFTQVEGGTLMEDRVEYEMPFGPLGTLAHALFVKRQLRAIFDYREKVIRELFR